MSENSRSIVYLISGDAHSAYLAVSLNTLRRHYQGDIVVYAYPESLDVCKAIAADKRLGVEVEEWAPVSRPKKNGQFLNKIAMMQSLRPYTNIYLDADTMITGSLDYLFVLGEQHGFVATQFNDWLSNGNVVRKRIERLLGRPGIRQSAVRWVLDNPLPSVNGGVFAANPNSDVLKMWWDWTVAVLDIFIADETCLHAIMGVYESIDGFFVAEGGRYNCSPKYQPKALDDEHVAVYHFHGDCNVRPDKSQRGYDLWWPEYQRCREENIGNINSWINQVLEKNRFLRKVEEDAAASRTRAGV